MNNVGFLSFDRSGLVDCFFDSVFPILCVFSIFLLGLLSVNQHLNRNNAFVIGVGVVDDDDEKIKEMDKAG